jgi:acyl-CoA dehydrogenase
MFLQEEVLPAKRIAEAQLPDDPVQRWKTIIPVTEDLKVKARCVPTRL